MTIDFSFSALKVTQKSAEPDKKVKVFFSRKSILVFKRVIIIIKILFLLSLHFYE